MTSEEARALYCRAVAAGFRLEPGCRVRCGGDALCTVIAVTDDGPVAYHEGFGVLSPFADATWCDFREAPSLGCLLKQVRAAWGDTAACTMSHTVSGVVEWLIWMPGHDRAATPDESRPAESDALVAALEAAPKVTP